MKFTYPAVFKKEENGRFSGRFVDLEGCEVDGYSLDDAIRNAILAEGDWIRLELLEDEPVMPLITDIEDISLREGEIARNIAAKRCTSWNCVNIQTASAPGTSNIHSRCGKAFAKIVNSLRSDSTVFAHSTSFVHEEVPRLVQIV